MIYLLLLNLFDCCVYCILFLLFVVLKLKILSIRETRRKTDVPHSFSL